MRPSLIYYPIYKEITKYKVVSLYGSCSEQQELLDNLGEEGWTLISVAGHGRNTDITAYLSKVVYIKR